MNKVIILDNILRYKNGNCFNTGWMYEIFGFLIKQVSNIKVQKSLEDDNKNFYDEIYKALGINVVDENSWISIYNAKNNEISLNIIKRYFESSLVIAYELHPFLQEAFDILNIPYLKFMCHPVRYMDDIFFGITSNNKSVFSKLLAYKTDENAWRLQSAFLKANTARKDFCGEIKLNENSCVFFAQTNVDCSLLDKNKIVSFFDYQEQFMDNYNKYNHLYYKVHPCAQNKEVIKFIKSLKNASILYPSDITAYDLIATDKISKYFSISSGALYEAKYFGKNIEYFLHQPFMFVNDYNDDNYEYKNTYVPVYNDYWHPSFWANILEDFCKTNKNINDIELNFKNKLRSILNLTWGFKDIDSVYFNNFEEYVKTKFKNKNIFSKLWSNNVK